MITNFEDITGELSTEDYQLVGELLRLFEAHTKNNPIKANEVVIIINQKNTQLKSKFTQVKLRKLSNFIRSKGMIGLIATSNGYYSSKDVKEIELQIQSLHERADAINNSAEGLKYVIQRIIKNNADDSTRKI